MISKICDPDNTIVHHMTNFILYVIKLYNPSLHSCKLIKMRITLFSEIKKIKEKNDNIHLKIKISPQNWPNFLLKTLSLCYLDSSILDKTFLCDLTIETNYNGKNHHLYFGIGNKAALESAFMYHEEKEYILNDGSFNFWIPPRDERELQYRILTCNKKTNYSPPSL